MKRFLTSAAILLLPLLAGCACAAPADTAVNDQSAKELIQEQIDTCRIVIPGISRDYRLLFLTDTHITIPSESDTPQEHDYTTERYNHFTGESGYAAAELFSYMTDYALEEDCDGLLLGGDIIDCPTAANLEYLDTALSSLQLPYIYTPGNHDWTFPWEYMTEKGSSAYLSALSPYMGGNTAIHTLEYDDFIIVAVDNSSNQIHPDALAEYQNILSQGKPVIVMLHVPFYTKELLPKASQSWGKGVVLGGGVHGGIYPNDTSAQFMALTTAKDSPVAAIVTGHVHLSDSSDFCTQPLIPQITGDAGYKGKSTLLYITSS